MPSQETYTRHEATLRLAELAEQKAEHAATNRKALVKAARTDTPETTIRDATFLGSLEVMVEELHHYGDLLSEGNPIPRLIRDASERAARGRGRPDLPGERHGMARAAADIIDVLTRITD